VGGRGAMIMLALFEYNNLYLYHFLPAGKESKSHIRIYDHVMYG
jgi:hypothetical protein